MQNSTTNLISAKSVQEICPCCWKGRKLTINPYFGLAIKVRTKLKRFFSHKIDEKRLEEIREKHLNLMAKSCPPVTFIRGI